MINAIFRRFLIVLASLMMVSAPALAVDEYAATVVFTWNSSKFTSNGALCAFLASSESVGGFAWECTSSSETYPYPYRISRISCPENTSNCTSAYSSSYASGARSFECPDGSVPHAKSGVDSQQTQFCWGTAPQKCVPGPYGQITVTTAYAYGNDVGSGIAKKVVPDGGLPNSSWCVEGCTAASSGGPSQCNIQQDASTNGYYKITCVVPVEKTGSECSPADYPDADQPPPSTPNDSTGGKCPAGSMATGTDAMGMTICSGTAKPPTPPTTTTTKPPTTTTAPDGTQVTTTETTATNADGSTTTTTKTTTTNPDGSTSTTISGSTSPASGGGEVPGVEDRPEDKSDLCKQNPMLNVCKNSQVIGTCAEITCEGDAIQCATLRAAAALECRDKLDRETLEQSSSHSLGSAVMGGTDPLGDSLPTVGNATAFVMPGSLEASGWLGGGAKFADKSFTVQGHTITIPFSSVLEYLIVFRYVMMIIALLVSFRILSGAIIRE